jgi:hypothetical protein
MQIVNEIAAHPILNWKKPTNGIKPMKLIQKSLRKM